MADLSNKFQVLYKRSLGVGQTKMNFNSFAMFTNMPKLYAISKPSIVELLVIPAVFHVPDVPEQSKKPAAH
jgi:hypothetical protein